MFGYATDETDECMPLTIVLAHKLNQKLAELRYSGALPWLRPDSKAQVCVLDQRKEKNDENLQIFFFNFFLSFAISFNFLSQLLNFFLSF